jgi:hypothetical protein
VKKFRWPDRQAGGWAICGNGEDSHLLPRSRREHGINGLSDRRALSQALAFEQPAFYGAGLGGRLARPPQVIWHRAKGGSLRQRCARRGRSSTQLIKMLQLRGSKRHDEDCDELRAEVAQLTREVRNLSGQLMLLRGHFTELSAAVERLESIANGRGSIRGSAVRGP